MQIRRTLLGDPQGDHNFMRSPDGSATTQPIPNSSNNSDLMLSVLNWHDRTTYTPSTPPTAFVRSITSRHPRYLDVPSNEAKYAAFHIFPARGLPMTVLIATGATSDGEIKLYYQTLNGSGYAVFNQDANATPAANSYISLNATTLASRYALYVHGERGGSQAQQTLADIRAWEYVELDNYLENLVSVETSYETALNVYDNDFTASATRESGKSLVIDMLYPRSDDSFRKRLSALLSYRQTPDRPPRDLEIHETINGFDYLQPVAVQGISHSPDGGAVLRTRIQLIYAAKYAYHPQRQVYTRTISDALHALQVDLTSGGIPMLTVPTPAEVRIDVTNATDPITVYIQPSGQVISFQPHAAGVFSLYDNGRLYYVGSNNILVDKTDVLTATSKVPPVLLPGRNNFIYAQPYNRIAQITSAFYPRISELQFV